MKKDNNIIGIDFFGEDCNIFNTIEENIKELFPKLPIKYNTYEKSSQIQITAPKALIIDNDFVSNKDWKEFEKYENSIYPQRLIKVLLSSNIEDRSFFENKKVHFVYKKGNSYDMSNLSNSIFSSINSKYRIKNRYVYANVDYPTRVLFPAKLKKFNENEIIISSNSNFQRGNKYLIHNKILDNLRIGKENIAQNVRSENGNQIIKSEMNLVSSEEIIKYENDLNRTDFVEVSPEEKEKVITKTLRDHLDELLENRGNALSEMKKNNIKTHKDVNDVRVLVVTKSSINSCRYDYHKFFFMNEFNLNKALEIDPHIIVMDYDNDWENYEKELSKVNLLMEENETKGKKYFLLTNNNLDLNKIKNILSWDFVVSSLERKLTKDILESICSKVSPSMKFNKKNYDGDLSMVVVDEVDSFSEVEIPLNIMKISEETVVLESEIELPYYTLMRIKNFRGMSFNISLIEDDNFKKQYGKFYHLGLISGLEEKDRDFLRGFNISYKKEMKSA